MDYGFVVAIGFASGTQYFAKVSGDYSGNQLQPRLVRMSDISLASTLDGTWENSQVTFDLDNSDHKFDDLLTDGTNNYIKGISCIVYYTVGVYNVVQFCGSIQEILPSSPNIISFAASYSEVVSDQINYTITTALSADCPEESLGQFGNIVYGRPNNALSAEWDTGALKALRISETRGTGVGTTQFKFPFLAAWNHLGTASGVPGAAGVGVTRVFNGHWHEVSKQCYVELVTDLSKTPSKYTIIWYASKMFPEVYFDADADVKDVTLATYYTDPASYALAALGGTIDIGVAYGLFADGYFGSAKYIYETKGWTHQPVCITDGINGKDFLQRLSQSFNCIFAPALSSSLQLLWVYLDWTTFNAIVNKFNASLVDRSTYQSWAEMGDIYGSMTYQRWYNFWRGYYNSSAKITRATSWENISGELALQYVKDSTVAEEIAYERLDLMKNALYMHRFDMPISYALFYGIDIGDAWKTTFQDGIFHDTERCLLIMKKTVMPETDSVRFEAIDVTAVIAGW